MKPELDPAQQDYDQKFNDIASSPDNSALNDQLEAQARDAEGDGFRYTEDKDRDQLAERERSPNGATTGSDQTEQQGLRAATGTRIGSKAKSLAARAKSLSTKKKLAIAGAGSGIAGVLIILVLFMLLASGFGLKQLAEVLQTANFGRVHLINYRRASQFLVQESLEGTTTSGDVRLNKLGKPTIRERLGRFNPNKALTNLGKEGQLGFIDQDRTFRDWRRFGRSTTVSEIKFIQIGNEWVPMPESGTWSPLKNRQEQRLFVQRVDDAIANADIFADKSRWYRTKTANAIFEAADIQLYRWPQKGRQIKGFKDAVLSAYDRFQGDTEVSSRIDGVDEAGEKLEEELSDALETNSSAAEAAVEAKANAVKSVSSSAAEFAQRFSLAAFAGTLYCGAKDYVENEPVAREAIINQAKRSSALVQSAADQTAYGDTTAEAVDSEVRRISGFEKSYAYQRAVNAPGAENKDADLDDSDLPKKQSGLLWLFMDALASIDNSPVDGVPGLDNIKEEALAQSCRAFTSPAGQTLTLVAEAAAQAVAAAFSGGTSATGSVAAKEGLEAGATQALKFSTRKFATKFATTAGQDIATMLAVNYVLDLFKGGASPALEDGPRLAAKADMGTKLLANDAALAQGGRPLDPAEVAELHDYERSTRLAQLHKKPLWYRLASLNNPYSPVTQLAVAYPTSPSQAVSKSRNFIAAASNPLARFAAPVNKVAAAQLGSQRAHAITDELSSQKAYGIQTIGFSKDEINRMVDSSFWPKENGDIVEQGNELIRLNDKYGKCFAPLTKDANIQDRSDLSDDEKGNCDAESLSSDEALRYRLYRLDGGLGEDDPAASGTNEGLLGQLLDLQNVQTDSAPTSAGALPTGDASTLAQQILANPRITYTTDLAFQAMQATAQGQPATIEARCGAGTTAPIDPVLLGVILKVAETYSVGYGYFTNGCHSSNSLHYQGKAVDINQVNGTRVTGGDADRPFMQYLTGILPNGSSMGEVNCSSIPITPVNQVRLHSDSCNHIHIGVP